MTLQHQENLQMTMLNEVNLQIKVQNYVHVLLTFKLSYLGLKWPWPRMSMKQSAYSIAGDFDHFWKAVTVCNDHFKNKY